MTPSQRIRSAIDRGRFEWFGQSSKLLSNLHHSTDHHPHRWHQAGCIRVLTCGSAPFWMSSIPRTGKGAVSLPC